MREASALPKTRNQCNMSQDREQTHQATDRDQAVSASDNLFFADGAYARSGHRALHQSVRVWGSHLRRYPQLYHTFPLAVRCGLEIEEFSVAPAPEQQRVVAALLDHHPVLDHDDSACHTHRTEPV